MAFLKTKSSAKRLVSFSGTNLLPVFVIGSLALQVLLFVQTTSNAIWIAKLARRPAPTLVELEDGKSIQVGAEDALYRSPQSIKTFVSQSMTMLFTASGTLPADSSQAALKPTPDPGVEVGGRKKVPTPAWEASFALSEDFRMAFLQELADITPMSMSSGTTQTMLVINHLSEPEQLESGKWRVQMIANLYTFTGSDRIGQAVPVNKDIYVKAIYVTPQPLPESATEIQRAVYKIRAAGLEITRFGELNAAESPKPKK